MHTHPILGKLPVDQFLSEYWQRKPLLLRGTLADYSSPLNGDELAGLSLEGEVESRLVECAQPGEIDATYHLRHGPFSDAIFNTLSTSGWSLLVQAVDLWASEFASLTALFDFIPPWRLDDVMASYSVPGGGVGPHFDHYDVFLLQAEGQRRWKIGQACDDDTRLADNQELSLLAEFTCTDEWLLEAGDILYIPPNIAHWGIAETTGMTLSVGFRSPSLADLLDDLATEVAADRTSIYLSDPPLNPAMANREVHPAYIAQVKHMLEELLADEQRLGQWLAQYMTRPRYPDLTEITNERRHASFRGMQFENGNPLR